MDYSEPSNNEKFRKGKTAWPVIAPQKNPRNRIWIPESFSYPILLHIIKNDLVNFVDLRPPLILAIQGRAGEGKSFQTRGVCSNLGVYVIPLSGASLGGSTENAAVEILEDAYIFASTFKDKIKQHTVLLIDDFDLSVASVFEERRYTVNTQLLTGFIMNLADDPNCCGAERTLRIPIIVTGNNFQALHAPLIRDGRINFFNWEPTLELKTEVVRTIFETLIQEKELQRIGELVKLYKDLPISFFTALMDDIIDEAILQVYKRDRSLNMPTIEKVVTDLLRGRIVKFQTLLDLAKKRYIAVAWNYLESDSIDEQGENVYAVNQNGQPSENIKKQERKFNLDSLNRRVRSIVKRTGSNDNE